MKSSRKSIEDCGTVGTAWSLRRRWPALFFAFLLALGCFLYRDYGISWDEFTERRTGLLSFCYALQPGAEQLDGIRELCGSDRYYGMGFQHLLALAEYLLWGERMLETPGGSRDIWQLRHLLTFLFVWCGLIASYMSGKMLWRRRCLALIPVLLFLLIPRFWAESFFNVKDMVFLTAEMIAGYFLLRMMKSPRVGNVLLCAVAAAFAASVRLIGGSLFVAGAVILLTATEIDRKKRLSLLLILSAVSAAALIAFYPIAWLAPIRFFLEAIQYMRAHPWNGGILFFGREYIASGVPWYYIPGWMAVTLPVPLLLLFVCGHRRLVADIAARSRPHRPVFPRRCRILFAAYFYFSLLAIMMFCRTCYNGWRQFYFLAWPLLFIAAEGLLMLLRFMRRKPRFRRIVQAALALWVASTLAWMVYVHPYQNLFFNVLAGAPNDRFELDYWHIASLDALRFIVTRAMEERGPSTIALDTTNYISIHGLKKNERPYVRVVPQEEFCRYFIYYAHPQWRPELGGRPFRASFPTGVRVAHEVNIRSSLFLHPVFVYRIYEFFPEPPRGQKEGI